MERFINLSRPKSLKSRAASHVPPELIMIRAGFRILMSKPAFVVQDTAQPGVFEAIYKALDISSAHLVGLAQPHLLIIPLVDATNSVIGGLWGITVFEWLLIQMLVVPEDLRGQGVGSALLSTAEQTARARGCRGVHLGTFSFQAPEFYRKMGYTNFGLLENFPPGHAQLYFCKRFDV
jgi:GNAT superfamily N-acetyltransferase